MAEEQNIFKPTGNGKKFFKRFYISTTGQLIGITQADVSIYLGDVNSATNNLTKKVATAVTQATQVFKSAGMSIPIKASEVLIIQGKIMLNNAAVGSIDNDFKFVVPASATVTGNIILSADAIYAETDLTTAVTIAAAAGLNSIDVIAVVINSTTAGNVDLQFAHNTTATDIQTVKASSFLNAAIDKA